MKSFSLLCLVSLVAAEFLHAANEGQKIETRAGFLPDSPIAFDEASSLLPFKATDPLSIPLGAEKPKLIKLYSENLIAEAQKSGVPIAGLRKCLKKYFADQIPYAAYLVKIKGKSCWLIASKKASESDFLKSGKLEHFSVYLIDSSDFELISANGCYCF